jgi:hypothetical protein
MSRFDSGLCHDISCQKPAVLDIVTVFEQSSSPYSTHSWAEFGKWVMWGRRSRSGRVGYGCQAVGANVNADREQQEQNARMRAQRRPETANAAGRGARSG